MRASSWASFHPGAVCTYDRYLQARLQDNGHFDATVLLRELEALGNQGSGRPPYFWMSGGRDTPSRESSPAGDCTLTR